MAPGAGVDFDHRRAQPRRGFDLGGVGGNEQRNADAGIVQTRDERRQHIVLRDHVEPAFGGHLLAPLGHQTHRMGLGRQRDPQHLLGRSHLEVQRLGDLGLQPRHVVVADVPAILTQVRRDAVGARLDRQQRGAHRIGQGAAAGVAQGGDVIDIDSETQRRS